MSLPQHAAVVARPASSPLKTTCLLCSDPVLVPVEDAKSKSAKKRNLIVKALCFHLQMNPGEVPNQCTAEMFPFCNVCEKVVVQLYENEKIIQAAQERISKDLSHIERTVADAELIRTALGNAGSSATAAGEDKKFMKLREAILDGYKTKLVMKQKLREKQILGTDAKVTLPMSSHTTIFHDKSISEQFNCATSTCSSTHSFRPSPIQNTEVSDDDDDDDDDALLTDSEAVTPPAETVDVGKRQASARASSLIESSTSNILARVSNKSMPPQRSAQRQPPQPQPDRRSVVPSSNANVPLAPASVSSTSGGSVKGGFSSTGPASGQLNDASRTMIISNVRTNSVSRPPLPSIITTTTTTKNLARPQSGRMNSHGMIVKQEPKEFVPKPTKSGKRFKRTLFQGIEIRTVTDPLSAKEYLQCGVCQLAIPNKSSSQGLRISPYHRMTQHIVDKHLGKKKKRDIKNAAVTPENESPKQRQLFCKICSAVFDNMKSLFEHRATHELPGQEAEPSPSNIEEQPSGSSYPYYVPGLTCDVCQKPIKGNNSNLLTHRFTHYNNEERKIALEKGERGSRQAFLRPVHKNSENSQKNKNRPKRRQLGKYQLTKPKRARNKALAKAVEKEGEEKYECPVCGRKFGRACHLQLHVNGHRRRSQLSVPVPLKKRLKVSFAEAPSVEQEQVQQEEATVPHENNAPQVQEEGELGGHEAENQEEATENEDNTDEQYMDNEELPSNNTSEGANPETENRGEMMETESSG